MEELITDILLSASLCADCFAVALCSSVTMKKVTLAQVLKIALIFAIIQTSFLFVGWAFGDFIARCLMHFVKWIGMGLLVFVGVSMIREAFSEEKPRNLTGFRNIVLAGIADSIDALAVEIILRTSFSAVPAFILVLPVTNSGPTTTSTGTSETAASSEPLLQVIQPVSRPRSLAIFTAPMT